jgi:copper chaperone
MLKSITLEVIGDQKLVCDGCEQRVERALREQQGVQKVRANARNQRIEVLFEAAALDAGALAERIRKVGYQTKVINPSPVG